MVIIARVGNKEFKKGKKVRVRYPSMNGGYIQYTCISKECGKALIKNIGNKWQEKRAVIIEVD